MSNRRFGAIIFRLCTCGFLLHVPSIYADTGGRLPATGGVQQIEGAGGGGLTTWALIAGYGTTDEWGGTAAYTQLALDDYALHVAGVSVGIFDRFEFSLAEQHFDLKDVVPGESIRQQIASVKWRIAGDALFSDSSWMPQLALAANYKRNLDFDLVPTQLGAKKSSDAELLLTASRMWFAALAGRNLLVNAGLRYTRANQFGLLGFGGDKDSGHTWQAECSAALFVSDAWLLGAEFRQKPDLLSAVEENDAYDVFVSYVPNRRLAVTAAYVVLGDVAIKTDQAGAYLSVMLNF